MKPHRIDIEPLEPRRLLAINPVAHYPFEEGAGTTTADATGNGNAGTLENGATFAEGLIARYGMSFAGTSYVQVASAAALNPTAQITVSAWINATDWNGNRRVVQKGNNDNQYRLLAEGGRFLFHVAGRGTASAALPSAGAWHHVAGTYDGTAVRLYVDGAQVASVPASGAVPTTSNPLFIGTKNAAAPAGDHFVGRIDDVRVYNVALNIDDVANLAGIINVNFQPAASATPAKFLADSGAAFGLRPSGLSYGWNVSHADAVFERAVQPDQRLDTLARVKAGGTWEIALFTGMYEVIASLGDPSGTSTNSLNVEGVSFVGTVALPANSFHTVRGTVNVTDGRLTIDAGASANLATRLNYVQVLRLDPAPNAPPNTPVITEPHVDGQIVNPADVHMEAPTFSDPDPTDVHGSSDWEIRLASTNELVWQAPNQSGVERVHIHLGDGDFVGSHASLVELRPDTNYLVRVRHRDNRGLVSGFASRAFTTGPRSSTVPLSLRDVVTTPAPTWVQNSNAAAIDLPVGTSLLLGSASGELLLQLSGQAAAGNAVNNPASLANHVNARARLTATSAPLSLQATNLTFTENAGPSHTVYLPAVALAVGQSAYFWVGADGSTYVATAKQTEPNFDTVARAAPVPFTMSQPGYAIDVVAGGFQLPTNIAFLPNPGPNPGDPLFYVTELYGDIKVVARDGTVGNFATNLLNFDPTGNFPGSGEQGLGGIVVHPVTGDLYVSMVYSSVPGVEAAPHYPKVVRFTSTDGGRTAATQTTILDMPGETMGQSHFISNVSINPNDGTLMVHVGDGFTTAKAQNPDMFRGKMLRLNLDGTAPADNPFYDASNGINARDYTFAMGFRNPFGGAWRQADGMHYEVENGPSVDRMAQIVAGRNYLWDGTNASMANFATYNWNPAHAPVNLLFIQQNTFNGSAFPASKLDHMFVSESGPTYASGAQANGKRITEFVLDAQGNLVTGPIDFLTYTGSGKGSVVALAAGPDGIYFSELYKDQNFDSPIDRGARVFRVRVLDAVRPTVAAANFLYQTSPTRLTLGFSENVSASLSLADIAVQNTTTQTPFNPTGLTYDASTNTATFTFPAGAIPDGNYRATLLADGVTDAAGNALAQDFNVDFFFLQGDANHDGAVNLNDFNALAANFGQSNRNFSHGDFNYDGTVNLQDFNLLAARFGAALAPSKTSVFDDVDDEEEEDDRTPGDLIA